MTIEPQLKIYVLIKKSVLVTYSAFVIEMGQREVYINLFIYMDFGRFTLQTVPKAVQN